MPIDHLKGWDVIDLLLALLSHEQIQEDEIMRPLTQLWTTLLDQPPSGNKELPVLPAESDVN